MLWAALKEIVRLMKTSFWAEDWQKLCVEMNRATLTYSDLLAHHSAHQSVREAM
jgi:transposase-like protein